MNCHCCSGKHYENCCEPFIGGKTKPLTAEQLMRSRYSAYVTAEIDYLLRSTHPSTRKFHDAESIKQWATANEWQKLEIISTFKGSAKDKEGTVEFKAYYTDENKQSQIHHEHSTFCKELGKWFFVDGKLETA